MNPADLLLFKSVAHSPDEVMRNLLSPQVGWDSEWIQTPCIKRAMIYMAREVLASRPISWVGILSGVALDDTEVNILREAWKQGKDEKTAFKPVVEALKTSYLERSADGNIKSYYRSVSRDPSKVRDHIGSLGVSLSYLAGEGKNYDPNPANHLQDKDMDRRGTWGDPIHDLMFSEKFGEPSGRPSYGLIIASMPTGSGKSCWGITMAAYTLAYSNDRVVIMSNELPRGMYSKGTLRALMSIYAGEESEDTLARMMAERMTVYAPESETGGMPVKSFDLMRQILFWERPRFAVMDSINDVAYRTDQRASEQEMHKLKSSAFRDTCLEYGVLMYAPGNMSNEMQTRLERSPEKVSHVMLFGSQTYENAADYAFLGWQNKHIPYRQHIKRCKNRHGITRGEVWDLEYDTVGGFYKGIDIRV